MQASKQAAGMQRWKVYFTDDLDLTFWGGSGWSGQRVFKGWRRRLDDWDDVCGPWDATADEVHGPHHSTPLHSCAPALSNQSPNQNYRHRIDRKLRCFIHEFENFIIIIIRVHEEDLNMQEGAVSGLTFESLTAKNLAGMQSVVDAGLI